MIRLFDRYILKEILPPFAVGLLLTTFVLLMNQLLLLAELMIDKGVPAGLAVRIFGLLVPSLLAFAVPLAVLMGILGGLARLSADAETTAFRTLGIGTMRLFRPFLLFGLAGWALTSVLVMIVAPRANYAWVRAMTSSVLARVELRINALEFNESVPGMVLFIENVRPDKSWQNVFAYLGKDPSQPRLVMARRGRINLYPELKRATLELSDGVVHAGSAVKPETYSLTTFSRLEEEVDVAGLFPDLTAEKRVREEDIGELLGQARDLKRELASLAALPRNPIQSDPRTARASQAAVDLRAHLVEIHKKFSLPFVCLIFALAGVPLGLMTGRGGKTIGYSIGLGIILFYYGLITSGEQMAMDGTISPLLAMWGPDILLGAAALWLFVQARRERQGSSALPSFLRRLVSKRGPSSAGPGSASGRAAASCGNGSGARFPRLSPRFPNILDRYVSRKYGTVAGLLLAGLMIASALVTFIDRFDTIHKLRRPIGLLVEYVWYKIPELLTLALPVTALAATLLVLGLLAKTHEIDAMKACGVSLYRTIVPVLILGAAVSGLGFILQERVLPAANAKAEAAWGRVSGQPARSYSAQNRHWALGRAKDRIYHYDYFDPASSAFSRLEVFDLDTSAWNLRSRAFAETALFRGEDIVVKKGWSWEFPSGASGSLTDLANRTIPAPEDRSWFLQETKEPGQMTYGELKAYADEIRSMGFEAARLRVDLAEKSALPASSLIMTLLAVPFAFTMGRKGALAGAGLSIVIAMVYWGGIGVFRSLGYGGVLSPFLAAWAANLVFGLAGIVLIFRLRT